MQNTSVSASIFWFFLHPHSFIWFSWKLQDLDLSVDFDLLSIAVLFSGLWYRVVWYMCSDDNSTHFNGCGCTSRLILFDPLHGEQGMRVWVPTGKEVFLFSPERSYLSGAHPAPYAGGAGTLFSGVKRPGHEAAYSPTSSAVLPKPFSHGGTP